jgi:hypothetical protein
MKHKNFSQDQNQKPAGASRSAAAGDLNQIAIDFAPSPDEAARRAYFRYACTRKVIPQSTPWLAFLLDRHATPSVRVART